MQYGIPYMGSKSKIGDAIISALPSGRRFVDLFGGGFAMSHCALLSHKYESVLYNEINPLLPELVNRCINGNISPEWVTRERFQAEKENDGYIKYMWSFGSSGREYIYAKEIEDIKRAGHMFCLYGRPIDGVNVVMPTSLIGCSIEDRRVILQRTVKDEFERLINSVRGLRHEYAEYKRIMDGTSDVVKYMAVEFTKWLRSTGIRPCEVDALTDSFMSSHYLCTKADGQPTIPTPEMFDKLKASDKINEVPDRISELLDPTRRKVEALKRAQEEQNNKRARLKHIDLCAQLFKLEMLERIDMLQRYQRIQPLVGLQGAEIVNGDYKAYEYREGDVVCCDPPYMECAGYNPNDKGNTDFDSVAFFDWAYKQPYPVYISHYPISDEFNAGRFYKLFSINKRQTLQGGNGASVEECVYVQLPFKGMA